MVGLQNGTKSPARWPSPDAIAWTVSGPTPLPRLADALVTAWHSAAPDAAFLVLHDGAIRCHHGTLEMNMNRSQGWRVEPQLVGKPCAELPASSLKPASPCEQREAPALRTSGIYLAHVDEALSQTSMAQLRELGDKLATRPLLRGGPADRRRDLLPQWRGAFARYALHEPALSLGLQRVLYLDVDAMLCCSPARLLSFLGDAPLAVSPANFTQWGRATILGEFRSTPLALTTSRWGFHSPQAQGFNNGAFALRPRRYCEAGVLPTLLDVARADAGADGTFPPLMRAPIDQGLFEIAAARHAVHAPSAPLHWNCRAAPNRVECGVVHLTRGSTEAGRDACALSRSLPGRCKHTPQGGAGRWRGTASVAASSGVHRRLTPNPAARSQGQPAASRPLGRGTTAVMSDGIAALRRVARSVGRAFP